MNSLNEVDLATYMKEKKINDSILEEKSIEKAIEDSIMLADGKILNGTLWFIIPPIAHILVLLRLLIQQKLTQCLNQKLLEIF